MKIGVLALQGAFREHIAALTRCSVDAVQIKKPAQLGEIDALIIPGGESTVIGKMMVEFGLMQPITQMARDRFPIFGTCAGMILLAKDIEGYHQPSIGAMDISVRRNAFGRQTDSFEADILSDNFDNPLHGVFIRAPYIGKAGGSVRILAEYHGKIVLAQQGNLLACAFHPELTGDLTLHRYFIEIVAAR